MSAHREVVDGGYDCEPVEPRKAAEYICKFCRKILRDPIKVSCCSSYYCSYCHKKNNQQSCPTCGDKLALRQCYHLRSSPARNVFGSYSSYSRNSFESGFVEAINELQVYCSNKAKGCKWTGSLKLLSDHLAVDPLREKVLTDGCECLTAECPYCSDVFSGLKINAHVKEVCSLRPYICQHCKFYKSTHEDVTNVHIPECDYRPVDCPNKCGETIPFHDISDHLDNICPNQIVTCALYYCRKRLPRKAISAHVLTQHIDELQISDDLREVKDCIHAIQEEVKQLKVVQMSIIAAPPVQFRMHNFEGLKTTGKEWFSEPFFTHPKGYKMCLNIDANGYGEGKDTHVSVFIYLMQGDFDSQLKWPFQGNICVQLVNQEGNNDHHEKSIEFKESSGEKSTGRVLHKERADSAPGIRKFIKHDSLKPQYLKDGCLQFEVISATIFSL